MTALSLARRGGSYLAKSASVEAGSQKAAAGVVQAASSAEDEVSGAHFAAAVAFAPVCPSAPPGLTTLAVDAAAGLGIPEDLLAELKFAHKLTLAWVASRDVAADWGASASVAGIDVGHEAWLGHMFEVVEHVH